MSGIFGVVSKGDCAETLFYGTDYHSHLGTEYGGLAVLGEDFSRQIHNVSQSQFKSKFCDDLARMKGNKGIGVTTLRYQMVEAIGRPREDLCLYCWTGQCPKTKRPKAALDIVDVGRTAAKRTERKVPV